MKNLPTFEYSMLEAFEDTSLGNLSTIENDGTIYVPAIETGKSLVIRIRAMRSAVTASTRQSQSTNGWLPARKQTAAMPCNVCTRNISARAISIG